MGRKRTEADMLGELTKLANKLNTDIIGYKDINDAFFDDDFDMPHVTTFNARFGNVRTAVEKAGLKYRYAKVKVWNRDDLADELRKLSEQLRRPLRCSDIKAEHDSNKSFPSYNTLVGKFGSFQNALEYAGLEYCRGKVK